LLPAIRKKLEKFNGLTQQLKVEVARINSRITEFLNYSRPAKLNPQPVDLSAVASDAMRLFEAQATESNVDARIEMHGHVPPVVADANRCGLR